MTGLGEVRARLRGRFITCNSNYEYYIHNGLWLNGRVQQLLSLVSPLLTSLLTTDTTCLHTYSVTTAIIQGWNAWSLTLVDLFCVLHNISKIETILQPFAWSVYQI